MVDKSFTNALCINYRLLKFITLGLPDCKKKKKNFCWSKNIKQLSSLKVCLRMAYNLSIKQLNK